MEECTICLEPMPPGAPVGVVSGCKHHYHEHCLLHWCSQSNSCPSCRQKFHAVSVVDQLTGTVRRRVAIQNRLLLTDAINNIPGEFMNPVAEPADEDIPVSVCSLCSSSDIRALAVPMMRCTSCFAGFHLRCLGITGLRDGNMDPTWCCPMCDVSQEVVVDGLPETQRRAPRPARRHTNPDRRNRSNALSQMEYPEPHEANSIRRSAEQSGLVIHNENGELDDSFLYDSSHISRPVLLNGGVLSRRETRQWQNLSPAEVLLWQMFHSAREGRDQESNEPPASDNSRRKRRRKRETALQISVVLSSSASEPPAVPTTRTSFSSIMNLVRSSPPRTHQSPPLSANHSPTGRSPMENTGNGDSDSQSDIDTRYLQKPSLTLEQKTIIQKHIRNYLRPLYKPNSDRSRIASEQEYVRINKSVSRKVYSYILSLSSPENGTIHMTFINDYLHDQSSLKETVDRFVAEELKER